MTGFSLDSAARAERHLRYDADHVWIEAYDEETYMVVARDWGEEPAECKNWDEVAEWLEAHRD